MRNRIVIGLKANRHVLASSATARLLSILLCSVFLSSSTGCVRFMANIIHAIKGSEMPAEYDGLKEQRVAVVCSTDDGLSMDATSALMTDFIHVALNQHVKKIDLVRPTEIEQWLDVHGTLESDYVEIGKAVKADKLVAIDLSKMRVKDGPTLYRGRCDVGVTVYDIKNNGAIVFKKQMPEFTFPKDSATIADTAESKFRNMFLQIIAKRVAGMFYPVDHTVDFGLDATANSL
jgi:hypothetical protein